MSIPVRVSRAAAQRKPAHGHPCNNCGACCEATLCPLAQHIFGGRKIGPCPAIVRDGVDSKCGLVLAAGDAIPEAGRDAALIIGTNLGCDARINGEAQDLGFAKACVEYDRRPDVIAARRRWGMPE